jgi:DNA-binding CsgD family transcriptional regulator
MAEHAMDSALFGDGLHRLTPREAEVLARTSRGETNAQVARALGISVHAVKFHLASVFRKLEVHNRTEAAAVYLQARPESLP